jgi:SNF2 family DNA or RNA helicase
LTQWGYFEVGLYNGAPKEREEVIHDFKLGRLDVGGYSLRILHISVANPIYKVITTFDLARRDVNILDDLPWSCIIVDEVHRVKNDSAKITRAYHQFNCLRRFGLTGTTIQNSYKEMWTILDWTNPDRVGTKRQWHGFVVRPLTMGQSAGATEEERAKSLLVALVLRDKLLPEFFLRRTKDIIKDQVKPHTYLCFSAVQLLVIIPKLPKKTDQVVFCPLTERQVAAYKRILDMQQMQNLILRDSPCTCGSNKT